MFWFIFYLAKWNMLIGAILGLLTTIILNIFFMKKLINNFYNFNKIWLIIIHLFFSICIFGFFMGVPVFNILPGIFGSIYVGKQARIRNDNVETFQHNLKIVNIFSIIVLIFMCFCSAYLALSDPYTASNLEGMFNLSFSLTSAMLWMIIIFGGIILLLVQYVASMIIAKRIYKKR